MSADRIRGKTIQWTFTDGPLANRPFERAFHDDGTLEFRMLDGKGSGKPTLVEKYEAAPVGANVHVVSYLGPSGYALTVALDFQNGKLVAFASNEKKLSLQHGTFRVVGTAKVGTGAPAAERAPSLR